MDAKLIDEKFDIRSMRMLIDGKLVESSTGKTFEIANPSTGGVITEVPEASKVDVTLAIDAAERAQPDWAQLPIPERARYMRELARLLSEYGEEILRIEVLDTGNIISEMRRDVQASVNQLNYYAGLGYELKGNTIPATLENIHLTIREPFGVVGRIIPFNHPLMFAAAKMAAPLIVGNTIVIKPSEQSPLSACCLAELCAEIFPPGVVNIVTGFGEEAGDAIVCDPRVKRIAFIGSVETGMMIQRRAAEHSVKSVSLELGGKNPMIVFPDADLVKAITGAIKGMNFGWQGQSCGSTSRLFLHESIHDQFVSKMIEKIENLVIGDPLEETSQVGPINNLAQLEKVMSFVEGAREEGANLASGGKRPPGKEFENGYWFEPTVFTEVDPKMHLAQKEVFGPVLSVFKWNSIDEVLKIANSLEYGLSGSIWSQNINSALGTARKLQSGYIWINGVGAHFPATPFGGFKNSGTGKEEAFDDMISYSEEKVINIML